MYNYNNEEGGGLSGFIRDLVIKLIFVIILVLLLIWLFPKPNMQPFYDRLYTENITLMKDTAKNYYSNERLPVNVDDKVTMTLKEMVDKHLILNLIDKDGNTCNVNESFVEVTKKETEYEMKVSLTCGDKTDYIIEYIGCTDVCATCEKPEEPLKEVVTKVVTKPKTIIKTVPVIKEVIVEVEKPCSECTPDTETSILYSKETETDISSWSRSKTDETTTEINGITTTVELYDTKKEYDGIDYRTKTKTIYSLGYIPEDYSLPATLVYPGDRLINLDGIGMSDDAQELSLSKLDFELVKYSDGDYWDYFSSYDYQRYMDTRYDLFYIDPINKYIITSFDADDLKESSLTDDNFKITDIEVKWNSEKDTFQVYTTAKIYDTDGVKPYYDSKLGQNVYYIPHEFKVSWKEPYKDYDKYYKYITTISYEDVWVLEGSDEEKTLLANGYEEIDRKTVTK